MIKLNIRIYDFLKYTLYFGRLNALGNLSEVIFVIMAYLVVIINAFNQDTVLLSRIALCFFAFAVLFEIAYKYFDKVFTFKITGEK